MYESKLLYLCLTSRIFIILLQFISNHIIPDHNAKVFQYLRTETNSSSMFINYTLGGFVRWDAEYFMHVAKYGYTFENSLAFFPLAPLTARFLTQMIMLVMPVSIDSLLLLVFIFCNVIFFILAVRVLYKLSLLIFDHTIAYWTSVLFIINPASIFFTAPYSECMFSYLTFNTIYYSMLLLKKYSKPYNNFSIKDTKVLFYLSLSTLVRSNGLLNVGFLIYTILCIFFTNYRKSGYKIFYVLKYLIIVLSTCLISVLPFILYQIYCYKKFCYTYESDLPKEIVNYASINGFILPGEFSKYNQSWCYNKLPLAYSYVQNHYWNVGFLKYYEFKQLPNFFLALPCLYIILKNCLSHLIINSKQLLYIFDLNRIITYSKKDYKQNYEFFKLGLSAFVIHGLFLGVFCLLFIHIQVATRMICSSTPLFYWYCTYYFLNGNNKLIIMYCFTYIIVGTVMFCNFLPWT